MNARCAPAAGPGQNGDSALAAYVALLGPVWERLQQINKVDNLQLTSIAKIIETSFRHSLKIIFKKVAEHYLGEMAPALLVTQELLIPLNSQSMHIREHIILYVDYPKKERTRFHIAHELGHVLLQQHVFDDRSRNVRVPRRRGLALGREVFAVEFKPDEEMAADLFAAVVTHQRPPTPRRAAFQLPCLRDLRKSTDPRRGLCHSELHQIVQKLDISCLVRVARGARPAAH